MNLNKKVEKIMSTGLTAVRGETPVSQLKDLFDRRLMHHILVEDEVGELQGIISTVDIARTTLFPYREEQLLAKHIMTVSPFTVSKDTNVKTVIKHFMDKRFRAIPVVDEKNILVGVVTPYDILSIVMAEFDREELNTGKIN